MMAAALALISCFLWPQALRAAPVEQMVLTPEQSAWMQAHPKIRIGVMNDWPPFNFVDKLGKPSGIGADLIRAMSAKLGSPIEIVPGSWQDIYDAVEQKQLDAIMDITPKPSREPFFNFTAPYLDVPHAIIARKDSPPFHDEEDLRGKTVALEGGSVTSNISSRIIRISPSGSIRIRARLSMRWRAVMPMPTPATGRWRSISWNGS